MVADILIGDSVGMPCCSLLRTRGQSRSLRCGWDTDAHLKAAKLMAPSTYG